MKSSKQEGGNYVWVGGVLFDTNSDFALRQVDIFKAGLTQLLPNPNLADEIAEEFFLESRGNLMHTMGEIERGIKILNEYKLDAADPQSDLEFLKLTIQDYFEVAYRAINSELKGWQPSELEGFNQQNKA